MILKEYVNMLNEMAQSLNEGYGRVNIFVYQGVGKKKRLPITGADLPKFFNRKGLTLFRDREKFTKTTIGLGKNINKWDVSNVYTMGDMFKHSPLEGNEPDWYKDLK